MLLASANPHKAEELARLLPGFEVQPYTGPLPPETGSSFRENALIKARAVHAELGGGCWVLPTTPASRPARWPARPASTRPLCG